jgi:FkbM family methyltransferase
MNAFELKLTIREELVDGFGPWYQTMPTGNDSSWNVILADWKYQMHQAIIDLVTDWSCVVQGGGHQGLYPFLLSNMFDHVITFEPSPINFLCLVKNCQKANITKIQAAIGASCGMVTFDETVSSGQHRVVLDDTESWPISVIQQHTVPCLSIDSLNLSNCGFIMLDLENYDKQGIVGALQTIKKFKPVICVEKSFIKKNDTDITEMLVELNYTKVRDFPGDTFFQVLSA